MRKRREQDAIPLPRTPATRRRSRRRPPPAEQRREGLVQRLGALLDPVGDRRVDRRVEELALRPRHEERRRGEQQRATVPAASARAAPPSKACFLQRGERLVDGAAAAGRRPPSSPAGRCGSSSPSRAARSACGGRRGASASSRARRRRGTGARAPPARQTTAVPARPWRAPFRELVGGGGRHRRGQLRRVQGSTGVCPRRAAAQLGAPPVARAAARSVASAGPIVLTPASASTHPRQQRRARRRVAVEPQLTSARPRAPPATAYSARPTPLPRASPDLGHARAPTRRPSRHSGDRGCRKEEVVTVEAAEPSAAAAPSRRPPKPAQGGRRRKGRRSSHLRAIDQQHMPCVARGARRR